MTQTNPLPPNEVFESDKDTVVNAIWAAVFLTAAGLAFFGFAISTVNFGNWQDYILIGFPLVLSAASLASIYIMRRGYVMLGTGIVFALNLILPVILSAIIRDTLWTALLYGAVSSSLLIWRALPRRSWRWSIIVTIATLIVIAVIQVINPPGRFSNPPALNTFIFVLTSILFAAFIVQTVRQTWGGSLRNKLLIAFIGVTLIATGTLSAYSIVTTTKDQRGNLERDLSAVANNHATQVGDLFNEQINNLTVLSLNEILQQAVIEQNQSYTGNATAIQAEIDTKDAQWQSASIAGNNANPLIQEKLTNAAALDLIEYQKTFPDNAEVFITDIHGGLVGTTNITSDYNQADEAWWQATYNNNTGAVYISIPEFDESAGKLGIQFALPLRNRDSGKIIGILRTTYILTPLTAILTQDVGETNSADIFIPSQKDSHIHEGLIEPIDPQVFEQLQAVAGQGLAEINYEGDLSVVTQAKINSRDRNPAIENLGWIVVFHQNRAEAFAPVNDRIRGTTIVIVVIILLAVLAAVFLAQVLSRPLNQLTKTAQEIAAGNLNSQAKVTSSDDEIGTLSNAFNSMTSQLRDLIGSLEGRVAARTKDMATVAEVGTATATILETDKLLQAVVDLTKERFNLYHSHIYLLDEEGKNLVLASGAGEPGRQMKAMGLSIPLNREQSLVARAAREQKGVTVNDVTRAADFLPNPLLPNTRSELAVPMIVGGKVIGVFDVQSDQVGRFGESDINIQTTLAAQVATSVQNVRSFEQAKKQADLETLVNAIGQKIQRATTVDDAMQTAIRELGAALGATRVSVNIGTNRQHDGDEASLN